jgi:hypothetical protein
MAGIGRRSDSLHVWLPRVWICRCLDHQRLHHHHHDHLNVLPNLENGYRRYQSGWYVYGGESASISASIPRFTITNPGLALPSCIVRISYNSLSAFSFLFLSLLLLLSHPRRRALPHMVQLSILVHCATRAMVSLVWYVSGVMRSSLFRFLGGDRVVLFRYGFFSIAFSSNLDAIITSHRLGTSRPCSAHRPLIYLLRHRIDITTHYCIH